MKFFGITISPNNGNEITLMPEKLITIDEKSICLQKIFGLDTGMEFFFLIFLLQILKFFTITISG